MLIFKFLFSIQNESSDKTIPILQGIKLPTCAARFSRQTFVMKYVFPVVWISGFGLGTICLWLGVFNGREG